MAVETELTAGHVLEDNYGRLTRENEQNGLGVYTIAVLLESMSMPEGICIERGLVSAKLARGQA